MQLSFFFHTPIQKIKTKRKARLINNQLVQNLRKVFSLTFNKIKSTQLSFNFIKTKVKYNREYLITMLYLKKSVGIISDELLISKRKVLDTIDINWRNAGFYSNEFSFEIDCLSWCVYNQTRTLKQAFDYINECFGNIPIIKAILLYHLYTNYIIPKVQKEVI